jgi:hypothetical protein
VKEAGSPTITPSQPKVVAAFEGVKLHPEFVLSRRELIRYVLSEPGQRNKEVQALSWLSFDRTKLLERRANVRLF